MHSISKVITAPILGLGIVAMLQGQAKAECTQYLWGTICVHYRPDLLPVARSCNGTITPGESEVTIFTEVNFGNTTPFCQIVGVPYNASLYVSDTGHNVYPGMYGDYHIKSIWLGSKVYGYLWSGAAATGSYKVMGLPVEYPPTEDDIFAHWGWNVRSFNFVTVP